MPVTTKAGSAVMKGVHKTVWTNMPNGNTGDPQSAPTFNDKSVHVTGTFGAGGSITIEGSNDGVNWLALHDPTNAAITLTAAGMREILENPLWIRPNVTAGDGTTSLTITLIQRGARV
ncbi:MAG: hypothetical protein C5B59_17270 [Bacteroidetes bacterium]|nr:MAG: hypothetical protein C5B59_17270 [Bacteroidota bacterium]